MPTHRVYFGDNQNISANAKMPVECHAYMPRWRAIPPSVISRIPMYTLVYQCIPMYTLFYPARIPHNYWPGCQQGHCLHPLLVWQWLIQKGCVFMQMCIEQMNIYDGSKRFHLHIFECWLQQFWSWYELFVLCIFSVIITIVVKIMMFLREGGNIDMSAAVLAK